MFCSATLARLWKRQARLAKVKQSSGITKRRLRKERDAGLECRQPLQGEDRGTGLNGDMGSSETFLLRMSEKRATAKRTGYRRSAVMLVKR